jgi:hypothetical protein
MIWIENKRKRIDSIQKAHPGAYVLDITSSSPYRYGVILSPFFPHGGIPVPGDSRGMTAMSVESIWQGLKVFEHADVDVSLFENTTMKGLKRTVRRFGPPIGHRFGVYSDRILNYLEAKSLIYIPTYKYVLENVPEVSRIIARIKEQAQKTDIVLLDYNINPGNLQLEKPLSHAELVKSYIEDCYPL